MYDDDFRLLKMLREKKKMNFRSIIIEMNASRGSDLHPKIARSMLNRMIKRGLIKEEGRNNWKRGEKLWYSLTEKGRRELANEALERINDGLMIIKEFSSRLLADESKLEDWRNTSSETIFSVRITEDMPLEERIRKVEDEVERTFGLLTETYKNMHRLVCEGFYWYKKMKQFSPQLDPSQFFIGFPDGYLYLVHVSFLKEKGLYEKPEV